MRASEFINEHIVKVKGGYELRSKHGNKNLGKYPSKAGAEKRERQVQYFKHAQEDIDEGWKDWVAGAAMGAAALGGASDADAATKKHTAQKPAIVKPAKMDPSVDKKVAAITKQVNTPAPDIETNNISDHPTQEHIVQKIAIQSGIKGVELAQFMAQTKHESADFSTMKEFGGKLDFKKYDPRFAPRKAKILGNVNAGDGARYAGRGFIQITGRDNYRRAGHAIGLPLEEHPELAAKPEVAAKIAVWYWMTRVKPHIDNFNDTTAVTKKINPALRGLEDRHSNFAQYKNILLAKR
jgi:predicted chitinase